MSRLPIDVGLRFFGEMTASISHEIKNRIAIVNEQAGLLDDLLAMAAMGRELDPERLARLAAQVKNQVALADDILRNMNRFAHSVDELWRETDVAEIPPLSAALSRRLANGRNVAIEIAPTETPIRIRTSPFLLMNLLWRFAAGLMDAGFRNGTLEIRTEPDDSGARLLLSADAAPEIWRDLVSSEPAASLLRELGAEAAVPSASGAPLILTLPGKTGAQ